MKTIWKDKNGNCKCECCGKVVPEFRLHWDKELGYCEECYSEIQEHDSSESQSDS